MDTKQLDDVKPIVDEWIRARGTSMDGENYAAALTLAAHVKAALPSDAAQAPRGWKLVPEIPTMEMLDRGHHQIDFDRSKQNTLLLVHESHYDENGQGTTIERDMRDAWAAMLAAAPVAPAAPNPWQDLYTSAMATLAPAFDYIQAHADQFGANAGDCKMAIIAETFPKLAAADVAQHVAPAAPAPSEETCKCRRLGDWKGFHHPLCDKTHENEPAAAQPDEPTALLRESIGLLKRVRLVHTGESRNPSITEQAVKDFLAMHGDDPIVPTPTVAADAAAPKHHDDECVDRFAEAMKAKLARAREKGRSGWEQCDPRDLSAMLREHIEKGDPRDVANFCMFLWTLGDSIGKAAQPDEGAASDANDAARYRWLREGAWYVDAATYALELRERWVHDAPPCDADEVEQALDGARSGGRDGN